ncbi:MAG TPA: hypothetical protein VH300_06920 [Thermoleophilaceae bacterium]|nr:hypothetical protein [Thermoleophilaceae bacterium]
MARDGTEVRAHFDALDIERARAIRLAARAGQVEATFAAVVR